MVLGSEGGYRRGGRQPRRKWMEVVKKKNQTKLLNIRQWKKLAEYWKTVKNYRSLEPTGFLC